jgi:FKBP-type peptidyl-prolyl cis-trans isomerase
MEKAFYFLCSFSLLYILFSCQPNNEIKGYKLLPNGTYFRLLQFGESGSKPKPGDYITAHISYRTGDDSVFFDAIRSIKLTKSTYTGSINECFFKLSTMDSASFIINADSFFINTIHSPLPNFIPPNSLMKVNIKMLSIRNEEKYKKDKEEFLSWIEDFGEYEQTVLRHFIENEKIDVTPTASGIYRIDIDSVNNVNKHVQRGDTIIVHYEGRFLNGKIFDSTKKRNEPFQFVYGTEWQVVKGLEEALGGMCEGDHALFIMPSELAFGKTGSSTGIIPPYTSVVFEVEVLEVKKATLEGK